MAITYCRATSCVAINLYLDPECPSLFEFCHVLLVQLGKSVAGSRYTCICGLKSGGIFARTPWRASVALVLVSRPHLLAREASGRQSGGVMNAWRGWSDNIYRHAKSKKVPDLYEEYVSLGAQNRPRQSYPRSLTILGEPPSKQPEAPSVNQLQATIQGISLSPTKLQASAPNILRKAFYSVVNFRSV